MPTVSALWRSRGGVLTSRSITVDEPVVAPAPVLVMGESVSTAPVAGCALGSAERPDRHQTHIASTTPRSEEHTSELQSRGHLVCRLLLEKKKLCYFHKEV